MLPIGAVAWTGRPDDGPACPLCQRALKGSTLEAHLATAGHSSHDPACERCHKHFSTFEALTEHLFGGWRARARASRLTHSRPGFKRSHGCGPLFAVTGCRSCLGFFDDEAALAAHACPFAHASVRPPP